MCCKTRSRIFLEFSLFQFCHTLECYISRYYLLLQLSILKIICDRSHSDSHAWFQVHPLSYHVPSQYLLPLDVIKVFCMIWTQYFCPKINVPNSMKKKYVKPLPCLGPQRILVVIVANSHCGTWACTTLAIRSNN